MKKMSMVIAVLAFGLMLLGVYPVIAGGDQNRGEIGTGNTYENGCDDQPCVEDPPRPGISAALSMQAAEVSAELDETEIEDLLFMREEEKMARDVYRVLYEKWGNAVFANIAASEEKHMAAMANLLAFYGLSDPVTSDDIGVFSNEAIADLYGDLCDEGLMSETGALLVGGRIEEIDIIDLWAALNRTEEERIHKVYQNLLEGSYNHLAAFVYNYELLTGESYAPQLLTDEKEESGEGEYDYVMNFDTRAKQAQEPKQQKGR